jgi:hypothetical protein
VGRARRGQGRRERLGRDLLRHAHRLPQARRRDGAGPGGGRFARRRGARAVEGYPTTTKEVLLGELHVGTVGMFAAAGFAEVSRPTIRRVVMRIDL